MINKHHPKPMPPQNTWQAVKQVGTAKTAVFLITILTGTLYFFPSGLPQISDLITVIFFILCMRDYSNFKTPWTNIQILLMAFVAYATTINLINMAAFTRGGALDYGFALSSSYFIFNGLFFLGSVVLLVRSNGRIIDLAKLCIIATLLFECIYLLFFAGSGPNPRASGSFNNPNQLAYYSLISLAIIASCRNDNIRSIIIDYVGILAGMFCILSSLSRAGIICALPFIFLRIPISSLRKFALNAIPVIAIGACVLMLSESISDSSTLEKVTSRMNSFDSKYENMQEERGYDRITQNPHYLLLGAGEGRYDRFSSRIEMHSSIGTILFSYGIPGSILFTIFIWKCVGRSLFAILILTPIAAYGLTHNGLRFTPAWLLLAFLYYQYNLRAQLTHPRIPIYQPANIKA